MNDPPAYRNRQAEEEAVIEVRSPLLQGDEIEYLGNGFSGWLVRIDQITTESGETVEQANPGNLITVKTTPAMGKVQVNSLLRKSASKKPANY